MRTLIFLAGCAASLILGACGDGSAGGGGGKGGGSTQSGGGGGAGGERGEGGKNDGGGGHAGGAGGAASLCQSGDPVLAATIDGERHEACAATLSPGGLNHVIGTLDNDSKLVVSFTGQVAASDVCVELSLWEPGATAPTWRTGGEAGSASGTCTADVTAYGARVVGSFAGTVDPVDTPSLGSVELAGGAFDVPGP